MTCSFPARKVSFNQSCGGTAELLVRIPQDKVFSPPEETSQKDTWNHMTVSLGNLYFFLNQFIEGRLTYTKLCVFNGYNLMNLEMSIQL